MTTATLRPNASSDVNDWTLVGAATDHAATSDNSDASYLRSNGSASADSDHVLSFGTTALPAGSVVKSITPRIRMSSNTADYITRGAYFIYTNDGGVLLTYGALAEMAGTTPATYSLAALTDALSQTQVDSLAFGIRRTQGYDEALAIVDIRVYELYLDLVIAGQPTTAVSAPSGAITTTSSPTATWSHTAGSDGGAQTHYQYRVFSAAQYGIGGFDPATSPATLDSGIVASSATSVAIGPLANSTTWRVYVRTAQTINGAAHWAAYAFSGFNTAFTTTDISSVVLTPNNSTGSISVAVNRNGATPAWVTVEVQRSDDGGTTWDYVRTADTVTPGGASLHTVVDYEAGNGVSVLYRARATNSLVTGAWTTSASGSWSSNDVWLKNVYDPTKNLVVEYGGPGPSPNIERDYGINWVVGRADPVVISDVLRNRQGDIVLETVEDADAEALEETLRSYGVLLLQHPASMGWGSRYIAILRTAELRKADIASEWRLWPLSFVEVAKPVDIT